MYVDWAAYRNELIMYNLEHLEDCYVKVQDFSRLTTSVDFSKHNLKSPSRVKLNKHI